MRALMELFDDLKRPREQSVLMFPHAGGSPYWFRDWRNVFGGRELFGVTYPGRSQRIDEKMPNTVEALAREISAEYCERIVGSHPPTPQQRQPILYGQSLGALVAWECAQSLLGRGYEPLLIVASQSSPFSVRGSMHLASDEELIADLVRSHAANAELFSLPEPRKLFLPIVRADYRLAETYQPKHWCALPNVAAVFGDCDLSVSEASVRDWDRVAINFSGPHRLRGGHLDFSLTDMESVVMRVLTAWSDH